LIFTNVETHLRCGKICNNHAIANCPQSVPVKELWKSINNWRRYGQKCSATFFWPTLYNAGYWRRCLSYIRNCCCVKQQLLTTRVDSRVHQADCHSCWALNRTTICSLPRRPQGFG